MPLLSDYASIPLIDRIVYFATTDCFIDRFAESEETFPRVGLSLDDSKCDEILSKDFVEYLVFRNASFFERLSDEAKIRYIIVL
jgi:hypothetical protein